MVDDLTTTQGSPRWPPPGWPDRADLRDRARGQAQAAAGEPARRPRRRDERDLVAHAARLETGFADLRDWVEESLASSERRMAAAEQRIDGCIAYAALVRYDAYNELSGAQSSSLALLDSHRTGVVLTSIVHRDQARIYLKQMHRGRAGDRALARGAAGGRPGARRTGSTA